ncbi:MAG: hypothetical protein HQ511_10125 [Rhodospirillales bacterium]|nr:hypothetical protein [Rhodospirillales bacterium]
MVILRHGDELTVINSVRLDAEGEAALDALGKVSHVMKIGFHGMDDAYYVDRYNAKMWTLGDAGTAPGDGLLAEDTQLPFPGARVFMFKQTVVPEAAILVERQGGLLITCDSVQHWVPKDVMSPAAKIITRLIGFQHPAQIGPPWRKKQTPPNGSLKSDFERLADLPFQRLIGGHGGLLERDGPAHLKATIQRELG